MGKLIFFVFVFAVNCGFNTASPGLHNPLIFFSNIDPSANITLQKELSKFQIETNDIKWGVNKNSKLQFLILKKNDKDVLGSYENVKELFIFIVRNSIHVQLERGKTDSFYNKQLFFSEKPLITTCGQISGYFLRLLIKKLNFKREEIRRIFLFDRRCFDIKTWEGKYLRGGHLILEIYFKKPKKWIMFDLDMGVIGTINGKPCSFIELTLSQDINLVPLGHGKYNKGLSSQNRVNNYYKQAINLFGFQRNKKFHFLFKFDFKNDLDEKIAVFKKNLKKYYKLHTVVYKDINLFYSKFYDREKIIN